MIIKGEKVVLRPMVLADAPHSLRWVNDQETSKLVNAGRKKLTLKEEIKWINDVRKNKKTKLQLAIETRDGVHIGNTGFEIIPQHKNATWGILIGDKRYWGKGYGTEVLGLILRYGFTEMKLNRIQLNVYEYNARAIALYGRAGFVKEGVRRKAIFYKGKFYDEIVMGMLRSEWENSR
jgi:RimJ/RimL family protein N-acetyltransferase